MTENRRNNRRRILYGRKQQENDRKTLYNIQGWQDGRRKRATAETAERQKIIIHIAQQQQKNKIIFVHFDY